MRVPSVALESEQSKGQIKNDIEGNEKSKIQKKSAKIRLRQSIPV